MKNQTALRIPVWQCNDISDKRQIAEPLAKLRTLRFGLVLPRLFTSKRFFFGAGGIRLPVFGFLPLTCRPSALPAGRIRAPFSSRWSAGAPFRIPLIICIINYFSSKRFFFGAGGIRTPGTLASSMVFETISFNHSDTTPGNFY